MTRIKLPPPETFKEERLPSFTCPPYKIDSHRRVQQRKVAPNNTAAIVQRMGIGLLRPGQCG